MLTADSEPRPFLMEEVEASIAARFEAIVAEHGSALAVRDENTSWTFAGLNGIANGITESLPPRGQQGGEPVVLLIESEVQFIAAILGVLKSGHIYVPLDPRHPPGRLQSIVGETRSRLLLCDVASSRLAHDVAGTARVICVEPSCVSRKNPRRSISPHDPCYILYTSGSTGPPKGVIHAHRNVLLDIRRLTRDFRVTVADRFALLYSPAFSASVGPIFGALLNGASLHIYPLVEDRLARLGDWLRTECITMCDISLMAFRELTRVPSAEPLSFLRVVGLGGERVDRSDHERFCRWAPEGCLLQNGYGSTETRTISHYLLAHDSDFPGNVIPVGWPVERKTVVLQAENGDPAPAGEPGEITVESDFLSSGYWRRPELTAQVFYQNPVTGSRVYKTGDLGMWLPDGRLLHLGRKDSQVKIRGHRVETLEVETALAGLAGCRESAVIPRDGPEGGLQLTAFIVVADGQSVTIRQIREHLSARLPEYSIPGRFFVVSALPRLANGKVDLAQLRSTVIQERSLITAAYVGPFDSLERAIARLAEEVFHFTRPGVHDDFFELGCDSLSAVRFLARLEEELGRTVPAGVFVQNPTIAGLAHRIREHCYDSPGACLIPINADGTRDPLFFFPGLTGFGGNWFHLSRHLGPDQPMYSLQAQGLDGKQPPQRTISEMAAHFAATIQRIQPNKPVNLLGYSAAGLVAHECARQLLLLGRSVNRLILVHCLDLGARRPLWQFLRRVNTRLARYRDRLRSHGVSGLSTASPGKTADKKTAVEIAIRRAMKVHYPKQFEASTVYIQPSKSDLLVPQRTWKPWRSLVSGSFEVCTSPGDHLTIVECEHAPELASVLRAHMG